MKNNILLLFAFFLIGLKGISQNSLGLKAGINLAYQTVTSTSAIFPHSTRQTKPLLGYQFGIFYKAKISKKLALSTEANFSVIGGRNQFFSLVPGGDTAFTVQYSNDKIAYFELPLLMQYNLSKFYISAGPSFLFKLFSKSTLSDNTLSYNSFDLAGKLLTGYHVSKKWDVNICYSYGLINVNKDSNGDTKRKNRYLNLSLLYILK